MNNVTDLRIRIEVSYLEEGVAFDNFLVYKALWVGSWKYVGGEDFVSVIRLLRGVGIEGVSPHCTKAQPWCIRYPCKYGFERAG